MYNLAFVALLSACSLSIVCSPAGAQSISLHVVGQDIEPFYFLGKNGQVEGALRNVMDSACKKMEAKCTFEIAPFRRSLAMLEEGTADVTAPLAKLPDREHYIVFSSPVVRSGYTFFGASENVKRIQRIEDVRGMTVGVHSPSASERSLEKIKERLGAGFQIAQETDVSVALKKAQAQRYEVAYVNRDIGNVWIRQNKGTIVPANFLADEVLYRFGFSKKTSSASLTAKFESAMDEMRSSGELKKALEQYGLLLPSE